MPGKVLSAELSQSVAIAEAVLPRVDDKPSPVRRSTVAHEMLCAVASFEPVPVRQTMGMLMREMLTIAFVHDMLVTAMSAREMVAVRTPESLPVRAPVVPGPADVIVVPVRAERECDDRDVDDVFVIRQVDVSAIVEVIERIGRDPAAIALPTHVAPTVIAQAAMDIDVSACGDMVDDGIIPAGSGIHIGLGGRVASRREGYCWRGQ